jgi:putative nucleotidyltransferase with HDIG domain
MNREEAFGLLTQYTTKDGLIKHALAVEACMREYAKRFGEDEEEWGTVGLIHDFDYERYPDLSDHPFKGAEILRSMNIKEDWIRAILGHGDHTGVGRDTKMAQALYACDEITGFVVAVALVRPSKKLADLMVKSVKKKLKDKAFAAKVSREDIEKGAAELGIPLEEHIEFVIEAMKKVSDSIGL